MMLLFQNKRSNLRQIKIVSLVLDVSLNGVEGQVLDGNFTFVCGVKLFRLLKLKFVKLVFKQACYMFPFFSDDVISLIRYK